MMRNRALLVLIPPVAAVVWTLVASWVTLWGLGMTAAIPWPSWQWWGYLLMAMPDRPTQDWMNHWLLTGAAAASLVTAALVYRVVTDLRGRDGGARPLHGRARFATRRDGAASGLIYARRPRPDCLILGRTRGLFGLFSRFVLLPGIEHVMLYAKTGSGKGVSYVVPNCLNYGGSLVVQDLKRENHRVTAHHRAHRLGQAVFLFAPLAADGRTHCWNPLGDIDTRHPDYISRLQRRAYELFPEIDDRGKFWQDGARTAFLGIAVLVAETPGLVLNPATVFRFFARGDASDELARLITQARDAGRPYSRTCIDLIADTLNGTEEVVKGVRKHVTATLGLFFNPQIAAATARSDFDLRDLRRRRMTVYVGVMPAELEQLGVLLRLFWLQLFEANTDVMPQDDPEVRYPAHALLDEFTAIGLMPAIARSAGFARGFGLHFSFVVQSRRQIEELYRNRGEASLLDNLGAEIFFGTDNRQLCEEASARAGYDTVAATSRSRPRFLAVLRQKEQNETTHPHRRALLLPQEIRTLPAGTALMFRGAAPPFLLHRLTWYRDRLFRPLQGRPDLAPALAFSTERDDGSLPVAAVVPAGPRRRRMPAALRVPPGTP